MKSHHYSLLTRWTGNKGQGTSSYTSYERSHSIIVKDKAVIEGSSDAAFRGDRSKHNPEEMLLASLSACHMLWYLHLCAEAKVVVLEYEDNAEGTMVETQNGGGRFSEVVLHPRVVVSRSDMLDRAVELHKKANELCFIANSVNFEVKHKPQCLVKD